MSETVHVPVLLQESIEALAVQDEGLYLDCTLGGGGHSEAILRAADCRLISFDRDARAIQRASQRLAEFGDRFTAIQAPFSEVGVRCEGKRFRGVLADLGISSDQLAEERGFSFRDAGPLDMRMDSKSGRTAAEWIATADVTEIADVLYQFGEERHSRRIARAIVEARTEQQILRTSQLADIVKAANPAWEKDKHPATRAFQAIRIHINSELSEMRLALAAAVENLVIGGRLVVISFHSLEDRIAKRFIAENAKGDQFPRGLPVTTDALTPALGKIGKAIKPSAREVAENPRARSAVMRIAEKISAHEVVPA